MYNFAYDPALIGTAMALTITTFKLNTNQLQKVSMYMLVITICRIAAPECSSFDKYVSYLQAFS
jgi:hypothetical protein